MNYVKYINKNTIEYGNKKVLKLKGKQIFNPRDEDFILNGFLPLIEEECPYSLEDYNVEYKIIDNKIYQKWYK